MVSESELTPELRKSAAVKRTDTLRPKGQYGQWYNLC